MEKNDEIFAMQLIIKLGWLISLGGKIKEIM